MTEDDDYMNDFDRPPRAKAKEDVMRPHERLRYRNSWQTEPTRWERLKQGLIQLAIIVGGFLAICGCLAWAAYWNGQ